MHNSRPCSRQKHYNKRNAQFVQMEHLQCLFSAENGPERLNSALKGDAHQKPDQGDPESQGD
jgi:hypothetical protein